MRTDRQRGRTGRRGPQGRPVRALVTAAGVAALAFVPTAAGATPGSGVVATEVAKGTSTGPLHVRAPRGRADVTFTTATIAPGGSTGWHTHKGQLIVVVKSGTLTRTLDDCTVEVTPAGTSFVEPAGSDHRHIGRNLGSEPVVLWVTYLLPQGSELSYDADPVMCGPAK
ncbi:MULTISPECIES: cupin domain-containing protein [unclassified Streptomyces]|uniref:cupin domain-containing protein n=1 Tax=unclassified Streptomyces TaxID=2593676 RepID=UPI000DAF0396|nr:MULTISPECIES: cupin domain-containing protein [unclassified Streptomyces]PZT74523.1 cupin domain-containing protein [Streptomyces sp. AC1-42T]PZT82491.1 cupin domain-containing protein [Streptomyces sp. AC1-42W]WUC93136.1 cupin domain-containing protein [Streptomyces sp. NBC_00525]